MSPEQADPASMRSAAAQYPAGGVRRRRAERALAMASQESAKMSDMPEIVQPAGRNRMSYDEFVRGLR